MNSSDDFDKNRSDKTILIVDDVSANLQLLTIIVRSQGYSILLASSGVEAMQIVKSKSVSIILLDIRMPEMDGFEFCRQLKADPLIQDIPIIFISAFDDEQTISEGFQIGGVDFISKPFRKEEVLARLKNHLSIADMRVQLLCQNIDLEDTNEKLKAEIDQRKRKEVLLTQPLNLNQDVHFLDLFDLDEIQRLQDQFAQAFGVASIITDPHGKPITNPSNFCRLCNDIIRKTEKGLNHCIYSDSVLGVPKPGGPTIQPCLSGGLWDAGSSITPGGVHIANWLIGQVRDQTQNAEKIREYAREIGANEADAVQAFSEVTSMSEERFRLVSEMLHTMTRQMSQLAYQNIQQARYINDRKHALELLAQSEEKFRNLADSSSAAIGIYQDDYWVYLNPMVELMSGFSLEELYKKKYWEIIAPEYQELIINNGKRRLSGNMDAGSYEFKVQHKNGSERWAYLSGSSITYNGRPAGIISIIDITDKKKAEHDILEERRLLRTLIDNLPDSIFVKDQYCRKVIANHADVANIGFKTESEIIGKTDLELFGGEIGLRGHLDDLRVIERGEIVSNRQEVFYDAEGKKRWLLTTKVPIFDNDGKISGLVGIGRDITEIKNAEEQILKLSMSIEQSPSTIVITDVYGNIEYVNPKFSEITGYSPEEAIGQNPRILKSGKMKDELYEEMWHTIRSGQVWRGEFLNKKKNNELYWEWAIIAPIRDEEGEVINYIAIKEDISVRKQMEAELLVAKNKAEESDRLKSAFLANMSHEIRTPLNSIIGFSELLADSHFEIEEKDEFIAHIISNGNSLLSIISDIMDISKMESGMVSIRTRAVSVVKIVTDIRKQFIGRFEEKRIEFRIERGKELESVQVMADPERLNQIFNNLVSNSLKFTTNGFVLLKYFKVGNMIQFEVKDTGIGIPADFHSKIFDRFSQAESSKSRRYGGNGLGLAITKNLIELMGGKIWFESEPEIGTSFHFTLPLKDYETGKD
jgi:PAS domain S-box-containing protein